MKHNLEIKFTESAGPVYCQSAILVGRFFVASSVVVNGLEQRQPWWWWQWRIVAINVSSTSLQYFDFYTCSLAVYCFRCVLRLQRHIEEVTFEALKKVLAEPAETRREAECEKRQMIYDKFINTPFQQLVANSQSKVLQQLWSLEHALANIAHPVGWRPERYFESDFHPHICCPVSAGNANNATKSAITVIRR